MSNISKRLPKASLLLLAAIPFVMGFGLWQRGENAAFNIGETYFVIPKLFIAIAFSIVLVIFAIRYWLAHQRKRNSSR